MKSIRSRRRRPRLVVDLVLVALTLGDLHQHVELEHVFLHLLRHAIGPTQSSTCVRHGARRVGTGGSVAHNDPDARSDRDKRSGTWGTPLGCATGSWSSSSSPRGRGRLPLRARASATSPWLAADPVTEPEAVRAAGRPRPARLDRPDARRGAPRHHAADRPGPGRRGRRRRPRRSRPRPPRRRGRRRPERDTGGLDDPATAASSRPRSPSSSPSVPPWTGSAPTTRFTTRVVAVRRRATSSSSAGETPTSQAGRPRSTSRSPSIRPCRRHHRSAFSHSAGPRRARPGAGQVRRQPLHRSDRQPGLAPRLRPRRHRQPDHGADGRRGSRAGQVRPSPPTPPSPPPRSSPTASRRRG